MSFLGYGASKALAYKHDFQKDIDRLYQKEAYASKVKADKERKTQYWAELMKEENPVNPSIKADLEKFYDHLTQQMSDIATSNPGWEQSVPLMKKMLNLGNQFIDNDYIRQDKQGQAEFEKLKKAATGDITQGKFEKEMEKYQKWMENYKGVDENGNQNGPYIYTNPKQFTLLDALKKGDDYLEPQTTTITLPNGKIEKRSEVSDMAYNDVAYSTYDNDEDVRLAVNKAYNGLGSKYIGMYETPQDYYAHMLKYGEQSLLDTSQYDEQYTINSRAAASAANNRSVSAFHSMFFNKYIKTGNVSVGDEALAFTEYGKKGEFIPMPAMGKDFYVQAEDGTVKKTRIQGSVMAKGAGRVLSIGNNMQDYNGSHSFVETVISVFANDSDMSVVVDDKGNIWKDGKKVEYNDLSEDDQNNIDEDKNGKYILKENADYASRLESMGFKKQKVTIPLNNPGAKALESINKTSLTITTDAWTGTTLSAASFSRFNQRKFDQNMGQTSTTLDKNLREGYYSDADMNTLWELSAANKSPYAEDLAKSRLNDIARDDIILKYGVSRKSLEWKARGNDPGVWWTAFTDKDNIKRVVYIDDNTSEVKYIEDEGRKNELYDLITK